MGGEWEEEELWSKNEKNEELARGKLASYIFPV